MLGKVLFIAPYKGLAALGGRLARRRQDLDVTVRTADLEQALPLLDWARGKGFDLIVSRGGTASLLERKGTLPVVEIPVSGYDLFRLTSFIKDYPGRVGLIGFPNVCAGVATFSSYLDVDIPYTVIHSTEEVPAAIRQARHQGRMIIGDTVTVRLAEEAGMKGLLVTSGPESVSLAFDMAANLLRGMQQIRNRQGVLERGLAALGREVALCDADGAQLPFADSAPLDPARVEWRDHLSDFFAAHRAMPEGPYLLRTGVLSSSPERLAALAPLVSGRRFLLFHAADVIGDRPLRLRLVQAAPASLSQLVADRHHLSRAAERAHALLQSFGPVALSGGPGTGRTRMLRAIQTALYGAGAPLLLCAEVCQPTRAALRQTLDLLAAATGMLATLSGVERLKRVDQEQLLRELANYGHGIVLLFDTPAGELAERGELLPGIAALAEERQIVLPNVADDPTLFEATAVYNLMEANAAHGRHLRGFSPAAMEALRARPWPNNYEELSHFIDRLVHDAPDGATLISEAPPSSRVPKWNISVPDFDFSGSLDDIEARIIAAVLAEENGNKSAAAARLGIGRSTLWRKLRRRR
ncbi:PrpR N-terminal domain-containing protein [Oleispirillum naphthae]|uniref:PrpR N-terminal domain-containing protein n=1 Tax=Oleispirillum naphthae TaxID=2838853 RepID=UPI00308253E8